MCICLKNNENITNTQAFYILVRILFVSSKPEFTPAIYRRIREALPETTTGHVMLLTDEYSKVFEYKYFEISTCLKIIN